MAKLPFWRTVREAYELTFWHLPSLLRAGWPALLLGIAVICGFEATVGWGLTRSGHDSWSGIVTPALEVMAGALMAVALHRTILLGEPVPGPLSMIQRPELRGYVWWALVLVALVMLPMTALFPSVPVGADTASDAGPMPDGASSPDATPGAMWIAGGLVIVALFVLFVAALSYVPTRLGLILPARALGSAVSARDVWQATRGSFWRLFWGGLLSTGLAMLPMLLYFAAGYGWTATRGVHVANAVLSSVCSIVGGMVGVAFLSLAYRHFFGDPPGSNPAAPE